MLNSYIYARRAKVWLAALVVGSAACAAHADITTGLVVQYALDGNANDASGSYPGTAANVSYVTGKIGQAASFNDASSSITVSSLAGVLPTGSSARTVAFWMNSSSTASNGNMVSWGARVANQRFSALQENGGFLRMIGESNDSVSTANLGSNVWHHVVLTYSGNTLTYYVDGALNSTVTLATALATSAAYGLRMGVNALPSNDEYYGGLLDEVRVYNRVLTAADVAELYAYQGPVTVAPVAAVTPQPVPTQSTWLLGLMGAAMAGLVAWRRRRSHR
jgi:MYXO-CTERM domain-containing protein